MKQKLFIIIMSLITMVAVTGFLSCKQQVKTANNTEFGKKIALNIAKENAQYWSNRIDSYLQILRTSAAIMSGYENIPSAERRNWYETVILSVFNNQYDFIQMFTVWKPNALDGMDNRYLGRLGSTETGQFAFAMTRENGKWEVITSSQVAPSMEYMNGPDAREDSVSEPIVVKMYGKDNYAVRLMVPIINPRTNETVGVVGCLLDIDMIQRNVEEAIKYDEISVRAVYSDNGLIIGSYRPERLGQMMIGVETQFGNDVYATFDAVKDGRIFECFNFDPVSKSNVQIAVYPVTLGTSSTTWSVMVGVPEEYIVKEINAVNGSAKETKK